MQCMYVYFKKLHISSSECHFKVLDIITPKYLNHNCNLEISKFPYLSLTLTFASHKCLNLANHNIIPFKYFCLPVSKYCTRNGSEQILRTQSETLSKDAGIGHNKFSFTLRIVDHCTCYEKKKHLHGHFQAKTGQLNGKILAIKAHSAHRTY